jgi:alpha-D-ribose 1-methylphosphonate 5-triphosphate synthase subunit PhnI
MYVAVKGGQAAIDAAHALLAERRRGDPSVPALTVDQIREQLALAVDRVMAEGGLYDRDLAALAIKQAHGDLIEAIFLLRAYRTTLPRLAVSEPVATDAMRVERRISATFKDLPGGQILGATFDYTHRLLDFALAAESAPLPPSPDSLAAPLADQAMPRVADLLGAEGLIEPPAPAASGEPGDITRNPVVYPLERGARLQALARGDEGFLLAIGYSTQRGYGHTHPFAAEIRQGSVLVEITPAELGFPVAIGEIALTECNMVNQFKGSEAAPPQFTSGYGLAFGAAERKAMAMALVDRSLRAEELGEAATAPGQDEEFVLSHADNVEASGFVQHLKLPHYVDFQSELNVLRRLREAWSERREAAE